MADTRELPCMTCAHREGGCCNHPALRRMDMGPGPDIPPLRDAYAWCQGTEWVLRQPLHERLRTWLARMRGDPD